MSSTTRQQKILLVGATSGLGRALCESYCKDGCRVGAIGRRSALLDQLQAAYPLNIQTFALDISSDITYDAIGAAIAQMGGIDKLILTASIVDFNPTLDHTLEKQIIRINVLGYVAVLDAAFQYFASEGGGHIVAVTSIAAARGNNRTPAYSASKAFQSIYLESIRLKSLKEKNGIHVTELIPGYMNTQMAKGDRQFWISDIDKAARVAKEAIDSKKTRVFITKRWKIMYTIYKFLPSFVYTYLINSNIKLQKEVD